MIHEIWLKIEERVVFMKNQMAYEIIPRCIFFVKKSINSFDIFYLNLFRFSANYYSYKLGWILNFHKDMIRLQKIIES